MLKLSDSTMHENALMWFKFLHFLIGSAFHGVQLGFGELFLKDFAVSKPCKDCKAVFRSRTFVETKINNYPFRARRQIIICQNRHSSKLQCHPSALKLVKSFINLPNVQPIYPRAYDLLSTIDLRAQQKVV